MIDSDTPDLPLQRSNPIAHFLSYPKLFHRYAGSAVYFVLLLVLLGGITEVIGITMILPIIELSQSSAASSPLSKVILEALNTVGLNADITTLLVIVVTVFVTKGAVTFWQTYMLERTAVDLARSLREQLFARLNHVSYEYFTGLESGTVANLLFRETELFTAAFVRFIGLAAAFIYVMVYFLSATALSWQITLAVILLGAVLLILMQYIVRKTRSYSHKITASYGETQSFTLQVLSAFLYLKATASLKSAKRRIDHGFAQIAGLNRSMALITAAANNIAEPLGVMLLAGLIYYQVVLLGKPVGEVAVVALIFYRAFGRLMSVQVEWQKFNRGLGSVSIVQRYFHQLDRHAEADGSIEIENVNVDIRLENVSYLYSEKPALQDIDLTISRNISIGIVGESGAGKSTLFLLIAGVLRPSAGRIWLGDTDYADLARESLQRNIGLVPQEPVLLNDTIANNICLWRGDSSEPEIRRRIREAADQAHCTEFISELPEEFDTMVGERGVTLSGGQKQRIAIARELFKKPGLIILDEATSALDTQSEKIVQESIEALGQERTLIIIAHRLSTIRKCDEIIVMSRGRIVERGRFDDLAGDPETRFHTLLENQKL